MNKRAAILQKYVKQREFINSRAREWSFSDEDRESAEDIISKISFFPSDVILDVGCGTGNLLSILKSRAPESTIIGLDFAFRMLQRYKYKNNGKSNIVLGLGEELPIKNESVNVIMNYCFFPHLRFKNIAIREFYRVLRKGGRYFIIHPQGRKVINAVHHSVGEPVCDDILEPIDEICNMLKDQSFILKKSIDRNDIFMIEAQKL